MQQHNNTSVLCDGPEAYGHVSRVNHWVIDVAKTGMLISGLILAYGPFSREDVGAIMHHFIDGRATLKRLTRSAT